MNQPHLTSSINFSSAFAGRDSGMIRLVVNGIIVIIGIGIIIISLIISD